MDVKPKKVMIIAFIIGLLLGVFGATTLFTLSLTSCTWPMQPCHADDGVGCSNHCIFYLFSCESYGWQPGPCPR